MKRTPDNPVESITPVKDTKKGDTMEDTKKASTRKTSSGKQTTKKPANNKATAPAKKGRPKKTVPEQIPAPAKSVPEQIPAPIVNQQVEREEDDRIDRVLKITSETAERLTRLCQRVNRVEERVICLQQTPTKEETTVEKTSNEQTGNEQQNPPQTSEKKPSRFSDENIKKWLKSDSKLPIWALIFLVLMLVLMAAFLSAEVRANSANVPASAIAAEPSSDTNVVTAKQGGIAINGDVTFTLTPERYATKEGSAVDITRSVPLIYINYHGEDQDITDPVKIGPANVSVGEDVVVESSDK